MVKTLLVGAITASLLVAAVVTAIGLAQTPSYEASARMWVNFQKLDDLPLRPAGGVGGSKSSPS